MAGPSDGGADSTGGVQHLERLYFVPLAEHWADWRVLVELRMGSPCQRSLDTGFVASLWDQTSVACDCYRDSLDPWRSILWAICVGIRFSETC